MTSKKKVESKVIEPVKEITSADKLWDRIKDLPIEIYALPEQTVSKHCKRFNVSPSELHLVLSASAVLPALEQSLRMVKLGDNEMFDISQAAHYTVVKIVPKAPVPM